ncbi:succinylglutamate desuccinylase/aspartoacylase family protein [Sinorhizobium meliloti]|uniref:succinylglutamate desuccinylase/aspartoacylase family protein n=1 Tax=Rhizobium meliloti TaxID=382 RepID=UPI000FDB6D17|nr:succinylglutamate desuccinylase/aspartoacylase family protein [Sinorhizobium meliloti]MDW9359595.1 deacylase [Sinorhizobium meliloti]MDW9527907.1 deacylase [Sinorhizobium meliloti]MDW9658866.1 deacylase [Sinorhizobium meliloti]MDW9881675.1 deacylase [Sinorhizobium meliloti]MDW9918832.1 deacylase [Sinorhizobium meliloti]
MSLSKIWTDIDLDGEGKSCGYFRLPLALHDRSGDDVGYSHEPIPVATIRNGDGPRVLLMAGNHGNEYEGQILLMKLIRRLEPNDIRGQIIFLPAASAPAVRTDARISPLDDGNLNRHFPGDPNGPPTAMIAHLIESEILPRVKYAFDFHSGSSSMEYVPCGAIARSDDPDRFSHSLAYLKAFGMPTSMIIEHSTGGDGAMVGACRRAGVFHMSTELGGGSTVSLDNLALAERGLERLLHHVGVLSGPNTAEPAPETRIVHRVPSRDYVYSDSTQSGLFEPLVKIGETVTDGQIVGRIHYTNAPWQAPEPIVSRSEGIVICRRIPARTALGDCIFALARDLSSQPQSLATML